MSFLSTTENVILKHEELKELKESGGKDLVEEHLELFCMGMKAHTKQDGETVLIRLEVGKDESLWVGAKEKDDTPKKPKAVSFYAKQLSPELAYNVTSQTKPKAKNTTKKRKKGPLNDEE